MNGCKNWRPIILVIAICCIIGSSMGAAITAFILDWQIHAGDALTALATLTTGILAIAAAWWTITSNQEINQKQLTQIEQEANQNGYYNFKNNFFEHFYRVHPDFSINSKTFSEFFNGKPEKGIPKINPFGIYGIIGGTARALDYTLQIYDKRDSFTKDD